MVLEAVTALAVDADDTTLVVIAFQRAATAAIEIRLVAADLAVVRAAEKAVVDEQVAVVINTVALLRDKPRFGARHAFRLCFAERTFNLALITRRIRVFGEEARIADAGDAVIHAAVAIVIETVAKLDAGQRLAGAKAPRAVGACPLPCLAVADVQLLGRPRKANLGRVVDADARAAGQADIINHAVAIVINLAVASVGAFGDNFAEARPELPIHTSSLARLTRTNALATSRTRITRLGLTLRAQTRRIGQADVINDAVAIVVQKVADIGGGLDRAHARPEFLVGSAGHRAAFAFALKIERAFNLFAGLVDITSL